MRLVIGFLVIIFVLSACKNLNPETLTSLAQKEIIRSDTISDYADTDVKPDVTYKDLIVGNTVISSDIFEMKSIGGILFQFNSDENERLLRKSGTNYNDLADDINFYSMGVYNLLVKNRIPVYITDKRFVRITSDSATVTIDTRRYEGIVGWKILLVDSLGSPKLYNTTDLDQPQLDAFFARKYSGE